MTAEEFAKQLGISGDGDYVDNKYVINLANSNEYSKVYTILDKSELVDLDVDRINLDVSSTLLVYLADEFDIELKSDFDNDVYTVSFEDAKDE